jgi:hypothetical protein
MGLTSPGRPVIDRLPQLHRGNMGPAWRARAAFGAVLLLAACSPAATQSGVPISTRSSTATASTSPTPVVFASTPYRYSITLPIGWIAEPATTTWNGVGAPNFMDTAVDVFGPAGESATFGVSAAAAPTTSTLAPWVALGIAENFRIHGDTCPETPDSVEPVTIGGHPGTLVAWNCGILINSAYTVVNGYGYIFTFRDPAIQAATDPADHATFMTMLGSVVFH